MAEQQAAENDTAVYIPTPGCPNPRPQEIRMTRLQASRCRSARFRGSPTRVWSGSSLNWVPRVTGRDWEDAEVYTSLTVALDRTGNPLSMYYVINPDHDPLAEPPPPAAVRNSALPPEPKRRCAITTMLDGQLIQMIRTAPNNSMVRARIMAKLLEAPPPEADTWEKVKDWVEFNFPKKGSPASGACGGDVVVNVNYSEVQLGSCHFRRRATGNVTVKLTNAQILEAIEDHDDWEDLIDSLDMALRDRVDGNIVPDYRDEEYEDFDFQDSDGAEYDYQRREFERKVKEIALANTDHDKLVELGLIEE